MATRLGSAVLAAMLIITAAVLSCSAAEQQTVSGTGTIRYVALEGGFYGIVADDGAKYDPMNLPTEFKQDGLRVRFELKLRPDMASIHMWGMIVEVLSIEKL